MSKVIKLFQLSAALKTLLAGGGAIGAIVGFVLAFYEDYGVTQSVIAALMVLVLVIIFLHWSLDIYEKLVLRKRRAVDKLWELRSKGLSLRSNVIKNDQEYLVWLDEIKKWRQETLEVAKQVKIGLAKRLERLDRVRPLPSNIPIYSEPHRIITQDISEMLLRLEQYLEGDVFDVHRQIS